MEKDKRYNSVKVLIDGGHLQKFTEIFDYIPMSTIYHDLGINYHRFRRCLKNPFLFTLREISLLANLFEVEDMAMTKIIYNLAKKNQ